MSRLHLIAISIAGIFCFALPAVAQRCDLAAEIQSHQLEDDLLAQKFDHYWYGTTPSGSFRPVDLSEIYSRLGSNSALLFYRLSTDRDIQLGDPRTALIRSDQSPDFLCAWLLDKDGVVAEVERPLGSIDRIPVLSLPNTIRIALRSNDPEKGWRGPPLDTVVLADDPSRSEVSSPQQFIRPSVALNEASRLLLDPSIQAALTSLPRKYRRLVIVPSRNLGSIPYAALPIGTGELIDYMSIVIMPSLNELGSDHWPTLRFTNSLVVGDPELIREDRLVKRGMFNQLPGARAEARLVADYLGVPPLIGKEATRQAVLQRLAQSEFIYFATHGVANDQDPNDRSYLLLSDGAFTARRIAQLKLKKNPTVVMSACQTGLGKSFESGIIGLAKAWKYAGASNVIMTLWNVYDEPTQALMLEFVHQLGAGWDVDRAMQNAMLKAKADERTRHPVFWAGFAAYGH